MVNVGEFSPDAAGDAAVTFAKPKSKTFTVPSRLILMLPGFRSRCVMPLSCAASRPSRICPAIRSASSSGYGPLGGVAFDVLHHQIVGADVVDLADVGMIQRGDSLGFALEAFGKLRGRDFDGDVAIQARIVGAIHLAHAADAYGARSS